MDGTIRTLLVSTFRWLATGVAAQNLMRPWTQWTLKDAEKILNDSAWGKTQAEYDQPAIGEYRTNRTDRVLNLRVRFLSAKPIRQALLRILELSPSRTPAQVERGWQFLDSNFGRTILVGIDFDVSGNGKQAMTTAITRSLGELTTDKLAKSVYLEIKGRYLHLQECQAPTDDSLGATFIFPRSIEDRPFMDSRERDVRFVAMIPLLGSPDLAKTEIKIDVRFKIADFMYNGVLEY